MITVILCVVKNKNKGEGMKKQVMFAVIFAGVYSSRNKKS